MTKPSERTLSGQGWVSFRCYRLYVSAQLAKQKVEIREFWTNLVVTYLGGAVVTYRYCPPTEEPSGFGIDSSPLFHDHRGIPSSHQLELFDLTLLSSRMRYVNKRPPNRKRFPIDAVQLALSFL